MHPIILLVLIFTMMVTPYDIYKVFAFHQNYPGFDNENRLKELLGIAQILFFDRCSIIKRRKPYRLYLNIVPFIIDLRAI
ncbi:hypothetical protein BH18THE1_BH18THE1_15170 [soil metagenome]